MWVFSAFWALGTLVGTVKWGTTSHWLLPLPFWSDYNFICLFLFGVFFYVTKSNHTFVHLFIWLNLKIKNKFLICWQYLELIMWMMRLPQQIIFQFLWNWLRFRDILVLQLAMVAIINWSNSISLDSFLTVQTNTCMYVHREYTIYLCSTCAFDSRR